MQPVNQHLLEKLRLQHRTLIDADGRVSVDTPCRACGYNLRGVGADGGCPECGYAVADALRDDRPEHSDPAWLRRVVLGANLCIAAIITPVALLLLLALLGWAGEMIGLRGHGEWLFHYGLLPVVALSHLLAAAAVWLVTGRDPGRHQQRAESLYRWVARTVAIGWLPALIIGAQFSNATLRIAGDGLFKKLTGWLTLVLPMVLLMLGLNALLLYLRTLSIRMRCWEIARSSKAICFGSSVCAVVLILTVPSMSVLPGHRFSEALVVVIGCSAAILVACYGIWAIILIDQTRRALNDAQHRVLESNERA